MDDVFAATGRHCIYKTIHHRCEPEKCSERFFQLQYQKNTEKTDPVELYDTQFHIRGKTVFRSCLKRPETTGIPRIKLVQSFDVPNG
jgi:hypothetical protein